MSQSSTVDQVRRPRPGRGAGRAAVTRQIVGAFFVSMGGVHIGIVAADAGFYRPFADAALLPFVRTGWLEVFMAHPAVWGLLVAAGETVLGAMLLRGGRWALPGWVGVIGFHLALMLFGGGVWLWCVPALAFLVPAAIADRRGTVPMVAETE